MRKALWARGLRFRLHQKSLPGRPDIVFPSAKLAVFVDGDFWHGRQWRTRGFPSSAQQFEGVHGRDYWVTKLEANTRRDSVARLPVLAPKGTRLLRDTEVRVTVRVAGGEAVR